MNLIGLIAVLVIAGAVIGGLASLAVGARDNTVGWVLVIWSVIALAAAWPEVALWRFAAREPTGMEGLIQRPVPYTTDHRFTPNGAHYAKHAIALPAAGSGCAAFALAIVASIRLARRKLPVIAPWLAFVSACCCIIVYSVVRLLAASTIFI